MDQADLTFTFKFLAQIADVDFQHVAFAAKIIAPDPVEDHFTCQDLFRMAQEQFKELILLGGQ